MPRSRISQPDWMAKVQVGDVLVNRLGFYRVVRGVSHRNGRLISLTFTIRHCSWTGRCHTNVDAHTLRAHGYEPTRARSKLASEIDRKIAHDLQYENRFSPLLNCCDVRGVA